MWYALSQILVTLIQKKKICICSGINKTKFGIKLQGRGRKWLEFENRKISLFPLPKPIHLGIRHIHIYICIHTHAHTHAHTHYFMWHFILMVGLTYIQWSWNVLLHVKIYCGRPLQAITSPSSLKRLRSIPPYQVKFSK